jgi:hypothetical protein
MIIMDLPPAVVLVTTQAAGDIIATLDGQNGSTVFVVDNGDGTTTVWIRNADGSWHKGTPQNLDEA